MLTGQVLKKGVARLRAEERQRSRKTVWAKVWRGDVGRKFGENRSSVA